MAVEFRCPDCRAKLRVPTAPPPGEEVECPKCGQVFPAPDLEAGDDPPPRAKSRDEDDDDRPKKKKKKRDAAPPPPAPGAGPPKKRKGKKKKSNPAVMALLAGGGVVFLAFLGFVLYYFLGRTPAFVEMLSYMPESVNTAVGVNISQLQKYIAFNKQFEAAVDKYPGWKRMDVIAKAVGTEQVDLFDSLAVGQSASGEDELMVLRTKKPFDQAGLDKLPKAAKSQVDGATVYTTPGGDKAANPLAGTRLFSPTPRLIVIAAPGTRDAALKEAIRGRDNDKSVAARMGAFGKRVTKGNVWALYLSGGKPLAKTDPFQAVVRNTDGTPREVSTGYRKMWQSFAAAQGRGIRFNVGKQLRVETVVWCATPEAAAEAAEELKKSDLAKGDEGTPPAEWKEFAGKLGDKKIGLQVTSAVSTSASGDLWYTRTEVDMNLAQIAMGSWMNNVIPLAGTPGS